MNTRSKRANTAGNSRNSPSKPVSSRQKASATSEDQSKPISKVSTRSRATTTKRAAPQSDEIDAMAVKEGVKSHRGLKRKTSPPKILPKENKTRHVEKKVKFSDELISGSRSSNEKSTRRTVLKDTNQSPNIYKSVRTEKNNKDQKEKAIIDKESTKNDTSESSKDKLALRQTRKRNVKDITPSATINGNNSSILKPKYQPKVVILVPESSLQQKNKSNQDNLPSEAAGKRNLKNKNEIVDVIKSANVPKRNEVEKAIPNEVQEQISLTGINKLSEDKAPQISSEKRIFKSGSETKNGPKVNIQSIEIIKPAAKPNPLKGKAVDPQMLSKKDKPSENIGSKSFEDEFGLMPKRKEPKKKVGAKKTLVTAKKDSKKDDSDDVYQFDFDDPDPGPSKSKAKKVKRIVKKKEPVLKLWDTKHFNAQLKQIHVNVINKDFKPKEKPIPKVIKQVKPAEIVPDISMTSPEVLAKSPNETGKPKDSPLKLVPWRFSSIRSNSFGSPRNDSNAENQNPVPEASFSKKLPHTMAQMRSPMKELNPNDSALLSGKRPQLTTPGKQPQKSKNYNLENCFGFEDSDIQMEDNNFDVDKFNSTIESLRKFRHGLKNSNQIPRRRLDLFKENSSTPIRNIFTSTPQQVKIRDCFRAAPNKNTVEPTQNEDNVVDQPDEDPRLFESQNFEEPPKRNYSIVGAGRKKRKVNFFGFSDDEEEDEEEKSENVDDSCSPRKRHLQHKKKPRTNKQEEELEKFCTEFNSMCDEVDQYQLITEEV